MNHRISSFTNNYGAAGVRAAVERVRDAGIRDLELALRGHNLGGLVIPEEAVITVADDDRTIGEFVEMLSHRGVGVTACNVGGGDLRTAEGVELTERRMLLAHRWFGPPVVVSGAGRPADAHERGLVVAALRRLGALARGLGQVIALETHAGPTQNAEAMLAIIGDVDDTHVRLNFDTGNIAYYNPGADPVAELEKVADLVRNVHLKDNRGGFEDWYFPALGEGGAVDFRRVRAVLDAVGYAGAYTIEIEGIGGEVEPGLDERSDRVRRSVAHLRACGYNDAESPDPSRSNS